MPLNKSIFIILKFWLLIDVISGLLFHYLQVENTGALFRAFFFILMNLFLIKCGDKRTIKLYLGITFGYLMIIGLQTVIFQDPSKIQTSIKVISSILLILSAKSMIDSGYLTYGRILSIININTLILLLNQYTYFFGLGIPNYATGEDVAIGGRGFIEAGNEVGVTIILIMD